MKRRMERTLLDAMVVGWRIGGESHRLDEEEDGEDTTGCNGCRMDDTDDRVGGRESSPEPPPPPPPSLPRNNRKYAGISSRVIIPSRSSAATSNMSDMASTARNTSNHHFPLAVDRYVVGRGTQHARTCARGRFLTS